MQCQRCSENEATVAVTTVVEDDRSTEHLCRVCAKEAGVELGAEWSPAKETTSPMQDASGEPTAHDEEEELVCPRCGLSFRQFKERYRVGCAECYDAFRERMSPLLRKVHSADAHTGKRPGGTKQAGAAENDTWAIEVLKRRLQAAVEREEFEEAAGLRYQINEYERRQSADLEEPDGQ